MEHFGNIHKLLFIQRCLVIQFYPWFKLINLLLYAQDNIIIIMCSQRKTKVEVRLKWKHVYMNLCVCVCGGGRGCGGSGGEGGGRSVEVNGIIF